MDLIQRLERLPMSRPQLRLLGQGGLGYTFDAMDGALIAFILPVVTVLWGLSKGQTGLLGSALLIGYLFGALAAGTLGDIVGRKTIMMSALAVYAIATVIAAMSPNWQFLFVFRTLAGFGTGAESAIIAPFLSEFIAAKYRGRFIGSLAGFFSFGYVGAAMLSFFIIPTHSGSWRTVQVLTALPIAMLLWWRRSIPESPRYLLSRGRVEEAEAVVRRLEEEVERATGRPLPPVPASTAPPVQESTGSAATNLAALWRGPMAKRTSVTWALWFCLTFAYYGFFTWIPSLLVAQGMTLTKSFGYSLLIYVMQIPGYFSAAFLSEKLDRKRTIALYLTGGALAALGLANAGNDGAILLFASLLSFFMNGAYAGLYSYTPEVYPTAIRSTGMGAASAFGRVGGIAAPIIIGFAYANIGFAGVFVLTTVVLFVGVLSVLVFGLATAGRTLEEINEVGVARPTVGVTEDKVGVTGASS
jgi:putative MFS transporter